MKVFASFVTFVEDTFIPKCIYESTQDVFMQYFDFSVIFVNGLFNVDCTNESILSFINIQLPMSGADSAFINY